MRCGLFVALKGGGWESCMWACTMVMARNSRMRNFDKGPFIVVVIVVRVDLRIFGMCLFQTRQDDEEGGP